MESTRLTKLVIATVLLLISNVRAEQYDENNFQMTMSKSLDNETPINFQMTSKYDGHFTFKYRFSDTDGNVDFRGEGVLFRGDEDRNWDIGMITNDYMGDYNFEFEMVGFDMFFGEEIFQFKLDDFMFFDKENVEFSTSGQVRSNEDISFNMTNNANMSLTYQWTFVSDDGMMDNNGRGQLSYGQMEQPTVGKFDRSWDNSMEFDLNVQVFDETDSIFMEWSYNNFTYDDSQYEFEMKNFYKEGEEVYFELKNFMDVGAVVQWEFQAQNDTVLFQGVKNVASGEKSYNFVCTFDEYADMMMNNDVARFVMTGVFMNSDMDEFREEVTDFKYQLDMSKMYKFEMMTNDADERQISVTNMMTSPMEVVYYFSTGDEADEEKGQFVVNPFGENMKITMERLQNYENWSDFEFWAAGYNLDTGDQVFSKLWDDFGKDYDMYDMDFTKKLGPGKAFSFSMNNNNDQFPTTVFNVEFYSTNGDDVDEKRSFVLDNGDKMEMTMFEFPQQWKGDEEFTFQITAENPMTNEEVWSYDFDQFNFGYEQAYDFFMSDTIVVGQEIFFEFSNNMNETILLDYIFYNEDGSMTMKGSQSVAPGDDIKQELGMVPNDFGNSTEFKFEMNGMTNKEQLFVFNRENFSFENRSVTFMMSSRIVADEEFSFMLSNERKDETMRFNWKFSSEDGQIEFKGNNHIKGGKQDTFVVGMIPRNYTGSRQFNFEINGRNKDNNEEMMSETMENFFFETGTYVIYMPTIVRPGFDITFSMTSTRNSDTMILVYDFFSEDMEVQIMGDAEIQRGESRNFVIGSISRGYQGSENFFFNITGFDMETSEKIFYEETNNFEFERKSVSMMIETDREVYQPGQNMKFRVVVLSPDLLPMDGDVDYYFHGPNGQVFKQDQDKLKMGVMHGEMPLHDNCQEGEWTLRCVYQGQEENMTMMVSNKQQSFNVYVSAPQYYYNQMQGINFKFSAKYPEGDGVKGSARLRAEIKSPQFKMFRKQRKSNVFRQNFDNFEQFENFFMSKFTLRELGWQSWTDLVLEVVVSVTDQKSGDTYEDMVQVDLRRTNINLDVQYRSDAIKRGMKYNAFVKVCEHDGKPLRSEDRQKNDLIIDVEYRYPIKGLSKNFAFTKNWADSLIYTPPKTEQYVMEIPPNGEVMFDMNVLDDNFEYASFRAYTNTTSKLYGLSKTSQWIVKPNQSPSQSYIQFSSDVDQYAIGDQVQFNVGFSEEISQFSVMVMGRGMILMKEMYESDKMSDSFDIAFDTSYQMAPGVKVFVSYVRDDGELVADYVTIALTQNLINEVDMDVSDDQFNFNQNVQVMVQGSNSDSYVGLSSWMNMNFNNDDEQDDDNNNDNDNNYDNKNNYNDNNNWEYKNKITRERVMEDMQQYSYSSNNKWEQDEDQMEPWWMWKWTRSSGAQSATDAIFSANLNVMTDAKMQQNNQDFFINQQRAMRNRNNNNNNKQENKYNNNKWQSNNNNWMWMNEHADNDGTAMFNASSPNMTSQYSFQAFVVSNDGFGVSQQQNVKIFEQLFVNMDTPMEITQNEVMMVEATVYNYHKQDIMVNMFIEPSDDYQLEMLGDDPSVSGPVRWLTVPAGGSTQVDYPMKMTTQGDVSMKVTVRSNMGEDSISRNVYVKPQGKQYCRSYSMNIQSSQDSSEATFNTFNVQFPQNSVDGSQQAKIFFYNDEMRNMMKNFDEQSSSNGMESMTYFSQAVNMYDYMNQQYKNVNQNWAMDSMQKYMDYMTTSYQNQMNYQHKDGSFSEFGDNDQHGSTWMTAWAFRTFKQMWDNHMNDNNNNNFFDWMQDEQDSDDSFMSGLYNNTWDSMMFVMNQQQDDGSFQEFGQNYNMRMQDDNSQTALTAFVMIQMIESGFNKESDYNWDQYSDWYENAENYLNNELENIKDDQYTLALVSYAMRLMESDQAQKAMEYFETFSNSNDDDSEMWWTMQDDVDNSMYKNDVMSDDEFMPSSACFEMTSYALMNYVMQGNMDKANKARKWLMSNKDRMGQFGAGQFSSSLAQKAINQWRMNNDDVTYTSSLEVKLSHSEDDSFDENVDMNQYMGFTTVKLPSMDGNVQMLTSGQGEGFAQLSICYNLMETPYQKQAFNCQQSQIDNNNHDMDSAEVEYCCSLYDDSDPTGLFFFQIQPPNGFTINADDQQKLNPDARFMNFDDGNFNVYYDQLEGDEKLCARAKMQRSSRVASNQQAYMMAQDYFNSGRQNIQSYSIDKFQDSKACNVCGMACAGCPGPQLSDWMEVVPCVSCEQKFSTWRRFCVDPSLNMRLDADECYQDEQEERRACNSTSVFPICPDQHDGLWRVLPTYSDKDLTAQDDTQLCHLKPSYLNDYTASMYENAATYGVPGTSIESYKSYLECDMSEASFGDEGEFSLSMMVNIQSFQQRGKGVIFAYGDEDKPAVFKLWHHSMYGSPVVFRVSLNNFIYTVGPIDGRNLLQKWTHIMVTWNKEETSFYINGTSVGWSFHFPSRKPQHQPKNPKLFIGRDTKVNNDDTLSGWVSSMDFWSKTLDKDQAQQVYNFYQPVVEGSRDHKDQTQIPKEALRYMAPNSYKQCFNENSSIRDLFKRQTCQDEY